MTTFRLGKIDIDAVAYGISGNAILGIKDSGKSYAATYIAERLFDAGIPFTTFDPTGIWRFMRVPGKGHGYPVVVAGGEDADLPLTVAGAPEIVRAAMRNGVSLIIDLFDRKLSKADWRRIVTSCTRTMVYENKPHGLRHVFLEEAAEFIPQKVLDGEVYAEVEKLARMGGNSRLGYTLINPRSQEVNKAVLELCESVLLFRQRGKNALENMEKWLAIAGGADKQKDIMASLPDLATAHCWAWIGGDKPQPPVLIKVQTKNSFHPDRRLLRGDDDAVQKKAVDVSTFVEGMKTTLVKVEEELKANDPKALRAHIAELERKVSFLERPALWVQPQIEYRNDPDAERRGYVRGTADTALQFRSWLTKTTAKANEFTEMALDAFNDVASDLKESGPLPPHNVRPGTPERKAIQPRAKPSPVAGGDGNLSPALQKVLDAIAWWRKIGFEPIERARASVVAGYSPKASTFGVYIAELVKLGLVEVSPGRVALTAAGLEQANAPTATTAAELRDMAKALLSPQEARVFDAVYDQYPKEIRRADVAEAVGLSPSASTCGVYIAGVAAYGIIENAGRGAVRAADWLFP